MRQHRPASPSKQIHPAMQNVASAGGGPLQIAIDLCSGGDLKGLLKEGTLSWNEIARATIDVACGMLFLSSSGFVHRDLAARNVRLMALAGSELSAAVGSHLAVSAEREHSGDDDNHVWHKGDSPVAQCE